MDDTTLSLVVVLAAGLVIAAIFLLARRRTRAREEALASYCAQRGYQLRSVKEPTARNIVIEGENWRLTSGMRALQNRTQAGSSDWKRETEWVCTKPNTPRKTVALMVSRGSTELEQLPAWVRETALSALRLWLGEEMQQLHAIRTAFCERGITGIAFETEANDAEMTLNTLRQPLLESKIELPLYLECSPERIRIFLPDAAVQTAEEADAILQIGFLLR